MPSSSVSTVSKKTLLSIRELCERWGISHRTVYRLKDSGELPPFIRVGNLIRFPIDGVIAFEKGEKQ